MGVLYLLSGGSSIRKDGGRFVIEKDGNIVGRVPLRSLYSVVVGHSANISTAAVFACIENKVPVFFVNNQGRLIGQVFDESISVSIIKKQLSLLEKPDRVIGLAKKLIKEKVTNQYRLLKGYKRTTGGTKIDTVLRKIKVEKRKIEAAKSLDSLRGIEGICAKYYFSGVTNLIDGRGWHFKGRSRPAMDPVNALLNFGYSFLEREVRLAIIGQGLDCRIGFFHSSNNLKDSLTFDLMELFRQPVIDRFVLNLIRLRVYKPRDFYMDMEYGCRLDDGARMLWYGKYENYMNKSYKEYGDLSPRQMIQNKTAEYKEYMLSNVDC